MAIAYLGGSGGAGSSVPLTKPTVSVGDFMFVGTEIRGGTGTTITPPAGWTLIDRQDSTTIEGSAIYYRVVDGTEGATFTWAFSNAGSAAAIAAYSGVDPVTPIDNGFSFIQGSVLSSFVMPSLTTVTANTVLIISGGQKDPTGSFTVAGGTWTSRTNVPTASAFEQISDANQAATGATGTFTITGATANTGAFHMVALRPVAGVAPSGTDYGDGTYGGYTYGVRGPHVTNVTLTATTTLSVSIPRAITASRLATTTPTGNRIAQTSKMLTGAVNTATATVIKQARKIALGTLTPTATIITSKAFGRLLTATATMTATVSRANFKTYIATSITSALIPKRIGKFLGARDLTDNFNDTTATLIQNHVSDSGPGWIKHPTATGDLVVEANRIREANAGGAALALLNWQMPTADYDVVVDINYLTAAGSMGIVGRADPTAATFFNVRWNSGTTSFEYIEFIAGVSNTVLSSGFPVIAGEVHKLTLRFQGTNVSLLVDDALSGSTTTSISGPGYAGIRSNTSATAVTGAHVEDFHVLYGNPVITSATTTRRTNATRLATMTPTATLVASRAFLRTLLATATTTATTVRQMSVTRTATQTLAPTVTRLVSFTRQVILTMTPTMLRRTTKTPMQGTTTATATVTRQTRATRQATVTPTSTVTRLVGKLLQVVTTTVPAIVKRVSVTEQATSTPTATFSAQKVILRTLAAIATVTSTLAKTPLITRIGNLTPTATITRSVRKALNASVTPTPSMVKRMSTTLGAALTETAVVGTIKLKQVVLSATSTVSASLSRRMSVTRQATTTPTATKTAQVRATRQATTAATASAVKQARVTKSATATTSPALFTVRFLFRLIQATVSATASVTRRTSKVTSADQPVQPSLLRTISTTFRATANTTGSIFPARAFIVNLLATIDVSARVDTLKRAFVSTVVQFPSRVGGFLLNAVARTLSRGSRTSGGGGSRARGGMRNSRTGR